MNCPVPAREGSFSEMRESSEELYQKFFGTGSLNGIPAFILFEISGSTLYNLARED